MKLTLLQRLIEFVIQFKVKHNLLPTYNYKVGEKVRYNWKAKVMIDSAIKENVNDELIINEIKHKRNEFINYQNTRTKKRGWTDAYWLKRA
jgi:hypothetical protein